MVLNFFSLRPPYPILIIISIVYASIVTHKKWICYFNMISLVLLCFYYLFLSLSYLDAWIGLVLSLIIINSKLKIDLELSRISPSTCLLNQLENRIYDSHFKKYLTKEQFKYLFDKGKMIKTKSIFNFATEGEKFTKIYYFALISHKDAVFISSNNIKLISVEGNFWFGTVDFLNYQREEVEWKNQQWMSNMDCDNVDCEVCYFEWNKDVMKNIFSYSIDHVLLNSMIMMWNNSNSTIIEELNKNIYREMNKIGNPGLNNNKNSEYIEKMSNMFINNSKDKGRENEDEMQEPLLSSIER